MSHLRLCFMFGLLKAQADPPRDRGPRLTARLHPHPHTLPHLAVSKTINSNQYTETTWANFTIATVVKTKPTTVFICEGSVEIRDTSIVERRDHNLSIPSLYPPKTKNRKPD